MEFLKRLFCVLVVPVLLMACASNGVQTVQVVDVIAGQLEISERSVLAQHHGTVDLLYFNAKSELLLRRADGSEFVLGEDGAGADARRAYGVLHADGDALYALWRPKLIKEVAGMGQPGEKMVYFRASQDKGKTFAPAQRLNEGGGAFNPVVASNGKGDVYVVYPDERNGGLELYMNVSHDHGVTWKEKDFKINGVESIGMSLNPSVVTDGSRVYVAWMTRGEDKQFKLFVRQSSDGGEHWADPVMALSSPNQPDSHRLVRTVDALLLCWLNQDAVRCSRSTDQNSSWSEGLVLDGSAGAEGILLETDHKGRAHVLVARKPEGDKARLNLFHAVADTGMEFSGLQRVSGGVPYAANTILPVLTLGDDDSVLVTWVDMRYARPVISANYSVDGGKSWLPDSLVLAAKKGHYHFFPTVAHVGKGQYSVAWQESSDRKNSTTVVGWRGFSIGSKGVSMPEPDVSRLIKRVDAFWNLRLKDKWDQVYDYMDPFFREANSRNGYVKSQGLVKYHGHRITGEPKVDGVFAQVPVAYESEVPEVFLQGKKIAVPRQEAEISHEWLWVDGDWYQVFRDIRNGSFLLQ